jgi:hypothetical protein
MVCCRPRFCPWPIPHEHKAGHVSTARNHHWVLSDTQLSADVSGGEFRSNNCLYDYCCWYFPSLTSFFSCGCRSDLPNQQQQLLKKSQSHSSVSSSNDDQQASSRFLHPSAADARSTVFAGEDEGFVRGGIRRSFTQPLTEQELRDADEKEVMSGASIAERCVWQRYRVFSVTSLHCC